MQPACVVTSLLRGRQAFASEAVSLELGNIVPKVIFQRLSLILLVLVMLGPPKSQATDKPLTPDDVTLLLVGGASSQKMVDLIKQRGIGFKMNAELATAFRRDGADESVIQALEEAANQSSSQAQAPASPSQTASAPSLKKPSPAGPSSSTGATSSAAPPTSVAAPAAPVGADGVSPSLSAGPGPGPTPVTSPANGQTQQTGSSSSTPATSGPILVRHAPVVSASAPSSKTASRAVSGSSAAAGTARAGRADLSDPTPDQVQRIIQAFAAKETLFKQARDNYTYHQINKVQEIGPDGEVTGQFQQDWDILYDDNGSRIERVTYAPLDTLKNLMLTEQDYDAFRSIQPFVLTTAELPEYDIQYRGHVQVDEVTAYVFSIRPKVIQKGRQYFQGMVWVDDRDLQIVKSEGKQVPEIRMKHGEENLFPRFTTWREQIDGKFWFPTFTLADDTLYFSGGPVHMKEIIRYTDYKQFKSTHKITNVASVPGGAGQQPENQKSPPKK
jgi:hypothetical protein